MSARSYIAPDLWDVASRHGLRPQRAGRRIRFLCPWCIDAGESPKKGRSASAAGDIDGNPWKCFRCEKTGTAHLVAAYFGDIEGRPPLREPPRPKKVAPKRSTELRIAEGWDQVLASVTDEDIERVRRWATEIRRWPSDVAAAVANMDDVAAPDLREVRGRAGAAIVRAAESSGRRLLIAIRCHRGIVRQVARRWMEPGRPPPNEDGKPGQKSMALATAMTGDPDVWGGTWVYGSIPEAMTALAGGEPLYLVEGAPDYLAASGVLQVTGGSGAVIGFYNTSTAKRVVEAIVRELGERKIIAPRIVLVPNIDAPRKRRDGSMPEHGVGTETALACAELLRGRAGVYLAEIVPGAGQAATDVADLLEREGTDAVAVLLRRAHCVSPPPTPIEHAAGELAARLEDAVVEATAKTPGGRKKVVILRVDAGGGKSWGALRLAARIVSGQFRIPVNGRRPRNWPEDRAWPPAERSLVFACPDHGLAEEKGQELDALAPGTPHEQIHGLLHHCTYADNVEDVFPGVGRRGICGTPGTDERCHLAETCPGADEPMAWRGRVTFCAHALLEKIRGDCVVVDESPGVIQLMTEVDESIASLYACRMLPRVKRWRQVVNPDAGDAAALLSAAVSPMAAEHAAATSSGKADRFPKRVTGAALVNLVRSTPGLVETLFRGYISLRRSGPPVPTPSEARSGIHAGRHMPSRLAWNAMRHLADYVYRVGGYEAAGYEPGERIDDAGDDEELRAEREKMAARRRADRELPVLQGDLFAALEALEEETGAAPADATGRPGPPATGPKPVVALRLNPSGVWAIEVRRVQPLPNAPVVMLDATGDLTVEEWRAAWPDRDVVMRSLSIQGTAPAAAIHYSSAGFSRGRLLDEGGLKEQGADRVRRAVRAFADRLRVVRPRFEGQAPAKLAILTHLPIAARLAEGLDPNARVATDYPGHVLQSTALDLARGGFDLRVGWYGRHDRGQNAWQDVNGLLVIGDPVGNLGDIAMDAEVLGLDPREVGSARTAATVRQAIARARAMRRADDDRVVLGFVGRSPPAVPGVVWTEEPLVEQPGEDLTGLVYEIARRERIIGVAVVLRFDRAGTPWERFDPWQVPRLALEGTVAKVAGKLEWRERRVAGVVLYSDVPDAVEMWASRAGLYDQAERIPGESAGPAAAPPRPAAAPPRAARGANGAGGAGGGGESGGAGGGGGVVGKGGARGAGDAGAGPAPGGGYSGWFGAREAREAFEDEARESRGEPLGPDPSPSPDADPGGGTSWKAGWG